MDLHTVARGSGLVGGLLGGLCWVVRLVLDLAGSGTGGAADGLYWAGLVLLALGLAGMGAGLVSTSALWLQAIVAVAFPLLVWSVLEVLHPAGNPRVIDGLVGLVVAGVAGQRLLRDRRRREARTRPGAHAR